MRERLFKFAPHGAKSVVIAFTFDKAAKNLPAHGAPWRGIGTLGSGAETGPRVPASCSEIFSAVERDGYAIWRQGPDGFWFEPSPQSFEEQLKPGSIAAELDGPR
jgi:hypothetical protein